jgi:PIF1-like helicase
MHHSFMSDLFAGVAAVNLGPELGAQTIHSLAGCGCPTRARDFRRLLGRFTARRWRKIEMLIIDEIGMLNADFLDWLDVFVRKARNQLLEPFGGIQLVCVGDFAQLGPIPGENSLSYKALNPTDKGADCFLNLKECAAYAFQTAFWREAKVRMI